MLAQRAGLTLKRTDEREGKRLRRRAGGYAHAKQYKRLRRVLKRQRTFLGRLLREIAAATEAHQATLNTWLACAWRIWRQRPKDKAKLYALHAPEVECIGKGKARQPYEFGVKASVAITEKSGLIVGARTFPGNPYDGHTLAGQLEQTRILLENVPGEPKPATVLTDLGYRGVDAEIAPLKLIHRDKYRTLSARQRKWLKRRQAVEPVIGHAKVDHGLRRCWLKGATGDALHVVLCAAGLEPGWLLRAIDRMGIRPIWLRCLLAVHTVLHTIVSLMPNATGSRLTLISRPPTRWFAARSRFDSLQMIAGA